MTLSIRQLAVVSCAAVTLLTVGCSKVDPETGHKPGNYSGKSDTRPFQAERSEFTYGNWNSGDKAAWESNLRARNQNQNEYSKTSQSK